MQTIYIRQRPAGWGVVIKPLLPGANDLGPLSRTKARAYAKKLAEQHGFPIVEEAME